MFGDKRRLTKIYNENFTLREKTFRFLMDNEETFADYPENNVYMIDREDLQMFNYINGPYETKISRIGLIFTAVLAAGVYSRFHSDFRIKFLAPTVFAPIPLSLYYFDNKLGEFLDYCAVKYRDKGLNDEDLWNYHKENSKSRFLPDS